jgi:hypothetical protein
MKAAPWIVLAVLATFAARAENACLVANRDGQQAEGRLDQVKITTEAYNRTETAFILYLKKPACLEGSDEYDKVESSKRIHVYSMDDKILRKLGANAGKTVRVTGSAFGESSPYHHAPIVMNVSKIERVR